MIFYESVDSIDPLSEFIDGYVVWCLTPPIARVEQELLTIPEHLSSSPIISGVRVVRSSIFCF
jgi:hypothetical protein